MNNNKIILKYNAQEIDIPDYMKAWMRSNHAGETGAVWIYKGANCVFWSKRIRKMAVEHGKTEREHLIIMEKLVPKNMRSRLILLWKIMGFCLGFLPSILGFRVFCATIHAVETFVEKHYNDQINLVENAHHNKNLLTLLKRCRDEEILHQIDAYAKILNNSNNMFGNAWFKLIGLSSELAVNISKRI
ncbi:MAG: hypothetical protein CBD16_00350 [Betaproteobacteria bacterium TMED156]|nr:MAG: hypothetical protein CBD16_00350 [Betaproteobacteria bacterium TMED156]|tara:strand:+ start:593 stop:1156 length:564 start_codon:yes stop_codon:yes gene_type:complete